MNEKTPESACKGTARRRLIRGIFAAPAVLPLYSGAQAAVASNRRCIQNEANAKATPSPVPTVEPSDTWVRVRLWTLSKQSDSGLFVDSTWIKASDVLALLATQPLGTSYYLNGYTWQCFSAVTSPPDSPVYVAGQLLQSGDPSKLSYTLAQNGSYVAIRVNANGDIIGVVDVGTGGGAVHHSCWTSFKR